MKKLSMFLAALTAVLSLSLISVPAMAEQIDEQYVVEEDGQTVVYYITYVEPNGVIREQTVSWSDANGTKFVHIYRLRPQQDLPDFSSYVTWYDANGTKYVLDQNAQTVTVYDVDGNMIAVMPA